MREDIDEIFEELDHEFDIDDRPEFNDFAATFNDNVQNRVKTLADVFLEWYLFDSSRSKTIKDFLESRNLQNVFTESEFMDLMCGKAWLDRKYLQIIVLKLPFKMSLNRLILLNFMTSKRNKNVYLIQAKDNIEEELIAILQQVSEEKKAEESERKAREKKHKREYRQKNSEHIARHAREYREANSERLKKRAHEYYLEHKDEHRIRTRQWKHAHYEERSEYEKNWRAAHKEEQKEYFAQYRKDNPKKVAECKRKCYLAKKKQYNAKNKENYEKRKQRAQEAKKVCAVYLFLLELRKKNKEQYLKLYTRQQDPIASMMKTCVALQNMDFGLCPLVKCDGDIVTVADKCGNPNVLAVPGANDAIQKILRDLRENTK